MVKQYVLSIEDFRILKDRTPDPCSECKAGPCRGDYGYLGCGREKTCTQKAKYTAFMTRVKEAGLENLLGLIRQIDALLAQKKDVEKQLNALGSKLGSEFGTKVLMDVSRNIYQGEF